MTGGHVSRSNGYSSCRPFKNQVRKGPHKRDLKGRHVKKVETDDAKRKQRRLARLQRKLEERGGPPDPEVTAVVTAATALNIIALL